MARITLVRHGRATGGWDDDPDPGLDDVGRAQAAALVGVLASTGPLPILTSPMRRCRETARPLAAGWSVDPVVEPGVTEIPSPPGVPDGQRVPWLQAAMTGTWGVLGDRYISWRDGVVDTIVALDHDAVVVSHFVAINAVIGAATGDDRVVIRSLDNCSRTVVETSGSGLVLIEGGHEADTLIR